MMANLGQDRHKHQDRQGRENSLRLEHNVKETLHKECKYLGYEPCLTFSTWKKYCHKLKDNIFCKSATIFEE